MVYLKLLWSFMQIGLFAFGGGYAALPLIQEQVITLNSWLTMDEFADVVTISQMTPGPIALNAATFVGQRVAGLPGAIVATIGAVLPSFIIVLILAFIYYKYRNIEIMKGILAGLRPAVVALIASAGLGIMVLSFWSGGEVVWSLNSIDFVAVGLFAVSLLVLRLFKKINPILVMVGSGVVGLVAYLLLPGTI